MTAKYNTVTSVRVLLTNIDNNPFYIRLLKDNIGWKEASYPGYHTVCIGEGHNPSLGETKIVLHFYDNSKLSGMNDCQPKYRKVTYSALAL